MNARTPLLALAIAASAAGIVDAQESERAAERLELTMTLLPEEAKDAVEITRRIELPAPPAAPGAKEGQRQEELPGLDNGRGQGLETAAEARERGREFGQDIAAEARENRENAGRGDDPPGRPENLPGPPADRPTPPASSGRP